MHTRTKVFILVLIAIIMVALNNIIISSFVEVELNTGLALEQFADPSVATDTASRSVDRIISLFQLLSFAVYSIAALLWLRKDIGRFIERM